MNIRFLSAALICSSVLASSVLSAQKAAPRLITITANDQMQYSMTTINAKPGEALKVRIVSSGTMPKAVMAHNFVLLAKGTDMNAFAMAAATSAATDYIPPTMKAKVLASTPMAGPGETQEVTFNAPKVAGDYDYLCSFAGHAVAGMKGKLIVK